MDIDNECSICYNTIKITDIDSSKLPCSHLFHADCLKTWWNTIGHKSCPYCRSSFDKFETQLYHEIDTCLIKQLMCGQKFCVDIFYLQIQLTPFIDNPFKTFENYNISWFLLVYCRFFISLLRTKSMTIEEIVKIIHSRLENLTKRNYSKVVNNYYVYEY